MSTHTTDPNTLRSVSGTHVSDGPSTRGGWAWSGVLAGVCGIVTFMVSPALGDFPDSAMADNALVAAAVQDKEAFVWIFQIVTTLTAVFLVVFGAGLRRRLSEQEPVGSLLPTVAFSGVLLTAAMSLIGGGISTELFWHLLQDPGKSDPDTIAGALTIFNTMSWVWAGLGLSAGAVAVASLRHGSIPKWVGWVSVAMTSLIVITQVVPLQYLALAPGALWLVIAGIGLARRERSS